MAPKRKASPSAAASKKKKAEPAPAPVPAAKKAKEDAPAKSPAGKAPSAKTLQDVWSSADYVTDGKMTQQGFASLIEYLGVAEMSFEALFLTFRLAPNQQAVEDAMIVCTSKQSMQSALDSLGCACTTRVHARTRDARAGLRAP